MNDVPRAKIFQHGRSQAVRLPKEFRLPGKEVRVRRLGRGVLLEPVEKPTPAELQAIFDRLEEYRDIPFMEEGRRQPVLTPDDDISFDE